MRLALILLVACGSGKPTPAGPGSGSDVGPVRDTRTQLEKRRDVACDALAVKNTECAVEDAKADLAAGKVTKKEFDLNTAPAILRQATEEWNKTCRAPSYSSRQVRVLEVCLKEETQCKPLEDCLTHLDDKVGK